MGAQSIAGRMAQRSDEKLLQRGRGAARILRLIDGSNGQRALLAPATRAASSKTIMKTFHYLLLWVGLGFLTVPATRAAESSLYDAKQARPLTPQEQFQFGPQSGKFRYDARMIRAAQIAAERARPHSTSRCWHFVKTALVAAHAVATYPKTMFAKEAAVELPRDFGFKKLAVRNPYAAPVGAVLVYGGADAGHVEIRTPTGFVSDFVSTKPNQHRPLIGVFVKPQA